MCSKKLSFATWLSVNKNTTFSLSTPTLVNKRFKSSRKEFSCVFFFFLPFFFAFHFAFFSLWGVSFRQHRRKEKETNGKI